MSAEPFTLAIGAGSGAFSVALRTESGVVHEARARTDGARTDLAPLVADLIARTGLDKRRVAEIRLEIGPGSYTGLRVAVTFARVLAAYGGARLATATSLEMIAVAALRQRPVDPGRRVLVALDARRHGYCVAEIVAGSPITLAAPPRTIAREQLGAELGQDALVLATEELALGDGVEVRRIEWPGAAVLFDSALRVAPCGVLELAPLYSMGSYAE